MLLVFHGGGMSVSCLDSCRFTMILAPVWKVAKVHLDLEASEVLNTYCRRLVFLLTLLILSFV